MSLPKFPYTRKVPNPSFSRIAFPASGRSPKHADPLPPWLLSALEFGINGEVMHAPGWARLFSRVCIHPLSHFLLRNASLSSDFYRRFSSPLKCSCDIFFPLPNSSQLLHFSVVDTGLFSSRLLRIKSPLAFLCEFVWENKALIQLGKFLGWDLGGSRLSLWLSIQR